MQKVVEMVKIMNKELHPLVLTADIDIVRRCGGDGDIVHSYWCDHCTLTGVLSSL